MPEKFYIVRTYSAGVFAGNIVNRSEDGKRILMKNAIKLWYWDGAFTLAYLAMEGTSKPENCKFSVPVEELEVMEAIEVLTCTEKAEESIKGARIWKP